MTNRNAVIFCTDRNMFVPAAFAADAIVQNVQGTTRDFDVVIVSDNQAANAKDRAWLSQQGIRHEICDFTELRKIFDTTGRLTTATLVKLILPDLFAGRYDRILYLDTDITIHADVSALFLLDLGDLPLAANRRGVVFLGEEQKKTAEAHFAELGMTRPFNYFNSGVMLINIGNWSSYDLTKCTLDFISRNRELCPLPDEDGLNAILDGRFAQLSPIWNMAPRRPPFMPLHRRHQPVIVHYAGHDKPWKRFGGHKPLFPDMQAYALYEAFLSDSPWPDWLGQQWTMRDLREAMMSAAHRRLRSSKYPVQHSEDEYVRRFEAFLASSEFIDVKQGITDFSGGSLRLRAACGKGHRSGP
jgi:lipopolysaccharide biosynthesis glycosyltransferase